MELEQYQSDDHSDLEIEHNPKSSSEGKRTGVTSGGAHTDYRTSIGSEDNNMTQQNMMEQKDKNYLSKKLQDRYQNYQENEELENNNRGRMNRKDDIQIDTF